MLAKRNIQEQVEQHTINPSIPLWKRAILLVLIGLLVAAIYYSIQGYLIEVLEILALTFFSIGVLFAIIFVISKESFLWIIGRRSEYNKVLKASQIVSIGAMRTAIKYVPIGLDAKEKERLKDDVPVFVQMRMMAGINNFIMRIFIGAFAAAFGLLGTIVLMKQNEKIDVQNEKVNIQNHLMEAERRSSLVFLMSNILDKVDNEIREQKTTIKRRKIKITDTTKYSLSNPLIGRIVALSRAFKPYKMMIGDTLNNETLSPERGQLFITLMTANLDSATQNTIARKGDFSKAVIKRINLSDAYLEDVDLRGANLKDANFSNANLRGANLSDADLSDANLSNAELRGANLNNANLSKTYLVGTDLIRTNLSNANLTGANLTGADLSGEDLIVVNFSLTDIADFNGANLGKADFTGANLTKTSVKEESLSNTKSLYNAKGINDIKAYLEKEKPCLFTNEGCN